MQVLLDSVIYGLQRYGGISQYWNELSIGLLANRQLALTQRLTRTLQADYPAIDLVPLQQRDLLPTGLARYMPLAVALPSDALLHTSYFRVPVAPGQRLVTTVYDFTYELYRHGAARQLHSLQKRAALNRSSGIICISRSTRDDALRHFPELARKRIEVIPLASDPQVFYVDPRARSALDEPLQQRPYVLFVGQRAGYKRFHLAVQAVAKIPELVLAFVGAPPTQDERSALDAALPGRWNAASHARNDMLRLLYNHAQAFVYPSDYEGFGLPILDAMACGCPVVCAKRSSFPEVVADAALQVPEQTANAYAAALTECLREPMRQALVTRGQARAATYSWKATTDRTFAFYAELLQGRSTA